MLEKLSALLNFCNREHADSTSGNCGRTHPSIDSLVGGFMTAQSPSCAYGPAQPLQIWKDCRFINSAETEFTLDRLHPKRRNVNFGQEPIILHFIQCGFVRAMNSEARMLRADPLDNMCEVNRNCSFRKPRHLGESSWQPGCDFSPFRGGYTIGTRRDDIVPLDYPLIKLKRVECPNSGVVKPWIILYSKV